MDQRLLHELRWYHGQRRLQMHNVWLLETADNLLEHDLFRSAVKYDVAQLPDGRYRVEYQAAIVGLDAMESLTPPKVLHIIEGSVEYLTVLRSVSRTARISNAQKLSKNTIEEWKKELGPDHTLSDQGVTTDDTGHTHVRYQQFYKAVKVFGGESIVHVDDIGNRVSYKTDEMKRGINLNLSFGTDPETAAAAAKRDISLTKLKRSNRR